MVKVFCMVLLRSVVVKILQFCSEVMGGSAEECMWYCDGNSAWLRKGAFALFSSGGCCGEGDSGFAQDERGGWEGNLVTSQDLGSCGAR